MVQLRASPSLHVPLASVQLQVATCLPGLDRSGTKNRSERLNWWKLVMTIALQSQKKQTQTYCFTSISLISFSMSSSRAFTRLASSLEEPSAGT